MRPSYRNGKEKNVSTLSLGFVIKSIRDDQNILSKQVAHTVKMDPATYSRIESGQETPSTREIKKIARVLNTKASVIVKEWAKLLERAEKS